MPVDAVPFERERTIIDVLAEDHRDIEDMITELKAAPSSSMTGVVVAAVVRHAITEEELVFPVVRELVDDGELITDRGQSQHTQVEETAQQLATTPLMDPRFSGLLDALAAQIRRHVRFDEEVLFPALRNACTRTDLGRLGDHAARPPAPVDLHMRADPLARTPTNQLIDQIRAALAERHESTQLTPAGDDVAPPRGEIALARDEAASANDESVPATDAVRESKRLTSAQVEYR